MFRRPTLINLALALTTCVLCLAVFEVSLRIAGWGDVMVFERSDEWGYLMAPNQSVSSYGHPVEINDRGLRGPTFREQKADGVARILYIGDSVTYGGGRVREDQLFCRRSEQWLNESGYNVEVLNLSAPGWSPQNWIRYIELNGLFDADLVVAVLPECDLARSFFTLEDHSLKETKPLLRTFAIVSKVYSAGIEPRLPSWARGGETEAGDKPDPETMVQANLEALRHLSVLCARERRGCLTVLVPSIPPLDSRRYWPLFKESLDGAVVDLTTRMTDPASFLDGVHLSVEGHEQVAAMLQDGLRALLDDRAMATGGGSQREASQ